MFCLTLLCHPRTHCTYYAVDVLVFFTVRFTEASECRIILYKLFFSDTTFIVLVVILMMVFTIHKYSNNATNSAEVVSSIFHSKYFGPCIVAVACYYMSTRDFKSH